MMKWKARLRPESYLLPAMLVLIASGIAVNKLAKSRPPVNVGINPQDFFVFATNSSYIASFRYDPRAADEWLFHFGSWIFATSTPPSGVASPY
jgi:hypothetical protein